MRLKKKKFVPTKYRNCWYLDLGPNFRTEIEVKTFSLYYSNWNKLRKLLMDGSAVSDEKPGPEFLTVRVWSNAR